MKKIIAAIMAIILSIAVLPLKVEAQMPDMKISLGASISEEERQMIIGEYSVWNDLSEDDVFIIDGNTINKYLQDGSNENTGVYSSSTVQINEGGNGSMWGGVEVFILTPGNITDVSETAYRNAAIAAGAKSAYINIFSPVPVTGEGALVGMYEIFSASGMQLDPEAIRIAELQIDTEQSILERSELSSEEVSEIILHLNYHTSKIMLGNDEISEEQVNDIINQVLSELNHDLSESNIELLHQHCLNYSLSPVAIDKESFEVLETLIVNKAVLEEQLYSREFETEKGLLKINDIYILKEGDPQNYHSGSILVLNLSITNGTKVPRQYHEFVFSYIEPIQDNDPNIVNELTVAGSVTLEDLDNQLIDIKPQGTMDTNMAYLIEDFETPVTLNVYPKEYREGQSQTITIDLSNIEVR